MKNQMVFKRHELKYLMTRRQQEAILAAMSPYMEPDEFGHSSIRNIYYDTPSFLLIRRSLEKPIYKEKLRMRSYGPVGNDDKVFVELKKKYHSVVYKRRISMPQAKAVSCLAGTAPLPDSQIGREISYVLGLYKPLSPAMYLSYERDAFYMGDDRDFRVTFDDNIRYRRENLTLNSPDYGTPILGEDQVLMELKMSGSMPLWMAKALSEQKIFKTSFSKYGTAYCHMISHQQKGVRQYA